MQRSEFDEQELGSHAISTYKSLSRMFLTNTICLNRAILWALCVLQVSLQCGCMAIFRDRYILPYSESDEAPFVTDTSAIPDVLIPKALTQIAPSERFSTSGPTRTKSSAENFNSDSLFYRRQRGEIRLISQVESASPSATDAASAPATDPLVEETATPQARVGDTKSIGRLTLDIAPPPGDLPPDHAAARFLNEPALHRQASADRLWEISPFHWSPAAVCHEPLYFEERGLERYGQRLPSVQPFVSAVHFFGRVPALPYLMAAEPPGTCVSPWGLAQPGDCAPSDIELPPADLSAALVQGGVTAGLFLLIP